MVFTRSLLDRSATYRRVGFHAIASIRGSHAIASIAELIFCLETSVKLMWYTLKYFYPISTRSQSISLRCNKFKLSRQETERQENLHISPAVHICSIDSLA